jgi:hypothetical protein
MLFSGTGFASIGKTSLRNCRQQLENFLKSSVINSEQQRIFTAVESSFTKIFNKQEEIHIRKFSIPNNEQISVLPTPATASNKLTLSLWEHILTAPVIEISYF